MGAPLLQRVGGAHVGHQVAGGKYAANIGVGNVAAVRAQYGCAVSDGLCGKRNVICDDHILGATGLGNPNIGGVWPVIDNHKVDQRMWIGPDAPVADHHRPAAVADGNGGDFVFHRTGICINIDRHDAPNIDQPGRLCIPLPRRPILDWRQAGGIG